MRSYDAARGSFSFFEILARLVIAVGFVAGFLGAGFAMDMGGRNTPPVLSAALGAIPGGFIALAGFYGLVMAQMGRASVDGAEYAQLSLSVARQQLELSQEALALSKSQVQPTYATKLATAAASATQATDQTASSDSTGQPSYADRSVTDPSVEPQPSTQIDSGPNPHTLAPEVSHPTAQLEHKTAVPVAALNASEPAEAQLAASPATELAAIQPHVDTEVEYRDGRYLVAGQQFWSRKEAEDYARETHGATEPT